LAALAVIAVFVPSFFMTGVSRSLFVPLSLAVGFAMLASYLLSSTLVPVLSIRLLSGHHIREGARWIDRIRERVSNGLHKTPKTSAAFIGVYAIVCVAVLASVGLALGREIFPTPASGRF